MVKVVLDGFRTRAHPSRAVPGRPARRLRAAPRPEDVNRIQNLHDRAAFGYRNPENQRRHARVAALPPVRWVWLVRRIGAGCHPGCHKSPLSIVTRITYGDCMDAVQVVVAEDSLLVRAGVEALLSTEAGVEVT